MVRRCCWFAHVMLLLDDARRYCGCAYGASAPDGGSARRGPRRVALGARCRLADSGTAGGRGIAAASHRDGAGEASTLLAAAITAAARRVRIGERLTRRMGPMRTPRGAAGSREPPRRMEAKTELMSMLLRSGNTHCRSANVGAHNMSVGTSGNARRERTRGDTWRWDPSRPLLAKARAHVPR